MTKETMTPDHPRWAEFADKLAVQVPECSAKTDKVLSRAILETMPEIDIQASMEFFESRCGFCDCEILDNIDKRLF